MMDNVKKFILMEKLGDLFMRKQDLKPPFQGKVLFIPKIKRPESLLIPIKGLPKGEKNYFVNACPIKFKEKD
jgi:hypothetical protein